MRATPIKLFDNKDLEKRREVRTGRRAAVINGREIGPQPRDSVIDLDTNRYGIYTWSVTG